MALSWEVPFSLRLEFSLAKVFGFAHALANLGFSELSFAKRHLTTASYEGVKIGWGLIVDSSYRADQTVSPSTACEP